MYLLENCWWNAHLLIFRTLRLCILKQLYKQCCSRGRKHHCDIMNIDPCTIHIHLTHRLVGFALQTTKFCENLYYPKRKIWPWLHFVSDAVISHRSEIVMDIHAFLSFVSAIVGIIKHFEGGQPSRIIALAHVVTFLLNTTICIVQPQTSVITFGLMVVRPLAARCA